MKPVVLKAHFDGRQIRLDEPYDLPANARLMITLLPDAAGDPLWQALAQDNLSRAYGDDEPDYQLGRVAEPGTE